MVFTRKITDYIGEISQIGGVKRYTFNSGKAKGIDAFDVNNGSGLLFTVVSDRGLDIYNLSYKGMPVSFISKNGIVSPCLFNDRKSEPLRSFTGGFLTTCGLTQVGEPCSYEGNENGLHGLYSSIPADEIAVCTDWIGDRYVMSIGGKIKQTKLMFEDLVLKRKITAVLGSDEIILQDVVTNEGSRREPFMILYHINFGYPLLNPECDIVIPSRKILGWDERSERIKQNCLSIYEPDDGHEEENYYHDLYCGKDGLTRYMIANGKNSPDIAVSVSYDKNILDNLMHWKLLRRKDYVMALEPCNNLVKGLDYESKNGNLKYLEPGESVELNLKFRFLSSKSEILKEKEYIQSLV